MSHILGSVVRGFTRVRGRLGRRTTAAAVVLGAVAICLVGTATAASAATGEVVVFSTEISTLSVYHDPAGCYVLPLGAHVLDNLTDTPVRLYADPYCKFPIFVVQPDNGSHVSPVGSFSV